MHREAVRNLKCPQPALGGFEQLMFREELNGCELTVENIGKHDVDQQTTRLSSARRTPQTSRTGPPFSGVSRRQTSTPSLTVEVRFLAHTLALRWSLFNIFKLII